MSAENAYETAIEISRQLLDLSGLGRDLAGPQTTRREQIEEFTRQVTQQIRQLYFLDISRPLEIHFLHQAVDAFNAAELIAQQILSLTGRGYDLSVLEPREHQLMEIFAEELTDLIMWLDWLSIRRPEKLYNCAMPYNQWVEPRYLMRKCVVCKSYFCKKHNLIKCVNCGNSL
jgi:hypothetical protein